MSKPCKSPTHYNITSGHEFLDYSFSLHPAPVPHKNSLCEILCETNRERVSCFQGEILFFLPILYNFAEPAVATVGKPTDQSPWLRISSGSELWETEKLPSPNNLRWLYSCLNVPRYRLWLWLSLFYCCSSPLTSDMDSERERVCTMYYGSVLMFSDLITIVGVSKKLRKVNWVIATGWIGQIFRLSF